MQRLLADEPLLAWAVQGCRDYFDFDGFETPDVIRQEIEAYRYEQDSIAQFLSEKCQTLAEAQTLSPDRYFSTAEFTTANPDLFKAYRKFCEENGERPRSQRRLSQNLTERGFQQLRSGNRYWEGLRLIETG